MIAAEANGREILFRLRLQADPRNATEAQKFAKSVQGIHGGGMTGIIPPGRSVSAPSGAAGGLAAEAMRSRERQIREERQLQQEKQKAAAEYTVWWEKQLGQQEAAAKKKGEAIAREAKLQADRQAAEAKRAADAEDREQERLHRRHRQRQLERARTNRAAREMDLAQARQAGARQAEIERGRDARRARFASARGGFSNEAFGRVGEGLMSVTTGAAALGLVGQRDSDKIMDTALTVGGGIQAAKGVMNFASGVQGMSAGGSLGGIVASAAASTGPLLAAAAALASVGVSAKMVGEISSGTAGEVDSFTSRVGRFEEMLQRGMTRIAGGNVEDGVYTQAYNAQQKTERMQKEREARLAMQGRQEALAGVEANGTRQLFDHRMGNLRSDIEARNESMGVKGTALAKANNIDETLIMQQAMVNAQVAAQHAKTDAARQEAAERLVKINQRLVDLGKESQQIAKQEADEKIRGAREAMTATKGEIELRKKSIEETQNRLMSAEERFGNLGDEEQQRVLAVGRQFREAQSLMERGGGNERHALYQRGRSLMDSISKEDRRLLGSVGLEGPEKAAREAAIREARSKGFGQLYGTEERSRIAAEEQMKKKLEVQLKQQTEVTVKLESDQEEVIRGVLNEARVLIDRNNAQMWHKVQQEIEKGKAEVNRAVMAPRNAARGLN